MFTGIIEEMGKMMAIKKKSTSLEVTIAGKKVLEGLQIGDSMAVNGVCLTVKFFDQHCFTVDVMPETFRRTSLNVAAVGSSVNLERALTLQTRLGGHLVSGHVDGVGTIESKVREDNALLIRITTTEEILYYIIGKGSIAIDGISLTVVETDQKSFTVSLIPHTAAETTLGWKKTGDLVNLEIDLIARYLAKFLTEPKADVPKKNAITLGFLQNNGFL